MKAGMAKLRLQSHDLANTDAGVMKGGGWSP